MLHAAASVTPHFLAGPVCMNNHLIYRVALKAHVPHTQLYIHCPTTHRPAGQPPNDKRSPTRQGLYFHVIHGLTHIITCSCCEECFTDAEET